MLRLTLSLHQCHGAGVVPVHGIQLVLVGQEPSDELGQQVGDGGAGLHGKVVRVVVQPVKVVELEQARVYVLLRTNMHEGS